jgi:hypothetical protein
VPEAIRVSPAPNVELVDANTDHETVLAPALPLLTIVMVPLAVPPVVPLVGVLMVPTE